MATDRKTKAASAALTPDQFRVTQNGVTGRPGSGALRHNKQPGTYVHIVSGEPLEPTQAEELA